MNQYQESYSQKNKVKLLDKYFIIAILFYVIGDLGTHAINTMYSTVTEQNVFMQPIASNNNWLVYAILVKIIIVVLISGINYLINSTIGYKILFLYGLYVTLANIVVFIISGPSLFPLPKIPPI